MAAGEVKISGWRQLSSNSSTLCHARPVRTLCKPARAASSLTPPAPLVYTDWFSLWPLAPLEKESRLKILVCMKQVPQKDAPLKLNEAGTWIREDVSYEVNEPDAYALEEALRQKEKHGGE